MNTNDKDLANLLIPYILPMIGFVVLLFTGLFLFNQAGEIAKQNYDVIKVTIDKVDTNYENKSNAKSNRSIQSRKTCEVYGSYEYNGVEYKDIKMTQHEGVRVNDVVEMCVEPSNPTYVFLPPEKLKIYGLVMIIVSIVIALLAGKSFITKIRS